MDQGRLKVRVLVANWGEIAVRIIRACHEIGLETVAVYSTADRDAMHVSMSDAAVCIGPPKATDSYLASKNIIQVALAKGCDAIHPGYGFLSENDSFARDCIASGLIFVGPKPSIIKALGDKLGGRKLATKLDIPVVPGTASCESVDDLVHFGEAAGYPILLKASAGGGGRGMRVVRNRDELSASYRDARAEARAAFGDDTIYAEKFVESTRHVEVQVFGDRNGNVIHLGTRDCTLQRRHQKVVEEAPAVCISAEVAERMCNDAVRLAAHLGYESAGTVEFIVDSDTGNYYFIEMNTRVQVEHPVTEMVTGVDIVRTQFVALDSDFQCKQEDIRFNGHAIEMRVTAEDAANGFMPQPGEISALQVPGGPGVQFDSHCFPGYVVTPFYDSLLGKLIVHDMDREKALRRASRTLDELRIVGTPTTVQFLSKMMSYNDVVRNHITTRWIEANIGELVGQKSDTSSPTAG